jgi:hypothetical protein
LLTGTNDQLVNDPAWLAADQHPVLFAPVNTPHFQHQEVLKLNTRLLE